VRQIFIAEWAFKRPDEPNHMFYWNRIVSRMTRQFGVVDPDGF